MELCWEEPILKKKKKKLYYAFSSKHQLIQPITRNLKYKTRLSQRAKQVRLKSDGHQTAVLPWKPKPVTNNSYAVMQ